MGIGASKGQGSEATYEKRDVETVSADKSNWPELAGAKLAESNGSGRKSYNIQILTTKYFSFQYSVTYCSQALWRQDNDPAHRAREDSASVKS